MARFAAGERLERGSRRDYRLWFGFFFLLPVWVGVGVYCGKSYLNHASGFAVWFLAFAYGLVFLALSELWARLVPANRDFGF